MNLKQIKRRCVWRELRSAPQRAATDKCWNALTVVRDKHLFKAAAAVAAAIDQPVQRAILQEERKAQPIRRIAQLVLQSVCDTLHVRRLGKSHAEALFAAGTDLG